MTIKELLDNMESTQSLEDMASSLTEIGSLELRKLRKQVEDHRVFFNDLTNIFGLLRYFAKLSHRPTKPGNGKTVTILLTSNERHYGKISGSATEYFIQSTAQKKSDQIVIGKEGAAYLRSKKYNQPYQNIIFRSDIPALEELKKLIDLVKDYSQILVIYSEFKSVMLQVPAVKDVTQRQSEALESNDVKNFVYTFILEPEINKIMDFFDSQIKNVLISGHFLEAQLARVASRLISMDEAQQNAKELLIKQTSQLTAAKRNLLNKRILETWVAVQAAHK